jgi:hypothetical protein
VALLLVDWFLEQGGSRAYLTGTRHLAEQVKEEVRKLGLEAVCFAFLRASSNRDAIALR